jgi:hypothetical protein
MVESAGENEGYQIRITYDTATEKYYVSGFIIRINLVSRLNEYDRDGSTVSFDTLGEAIKFIKNHE